MTYEQDRSDLARHEREIAALETFNFAVLNEDESRRVRARLDERHMGFPGGPVRSVSYPATYG